MIKDLTVVVVEDEKPAARRLVRMLEKLDITPIKVLHTVASSIQWFQNNNAPQLLFLDIQLSDGLSFEIFEQITIDSNIIFTTAYDEYALRAFKLKSIDYLLKPINEQELKQAIEKYKAFIPNQTNSEDQLKMIYSLMNQQNNQFKQRFSIKVGTHIRTVNCKDIECFYSEGKATFVATNDGKSASIDYSLEQLDDMLNNEHFFRINRKFIVNIDAINDIITYSNSRLKIKMSNLNNNDIIVSRERVKAFKEWLG